MTDGGEVVRVMDDEAGIVQALSAALRARGHAVSSATTGAGALDEMARRPSDAVILDPRLPDLDGVEVCRRIRRMSDVPVIATAEGAERRKIEALDEGADDYMTKPFSTPRAARPRPSGAPPPAGGRRTGPAGPATRRPGLRRRGRHRVEVDWSGVELTPKGVRPSPALARRRGRVLTHRALLQDVWGSESRTETQDLRVSASQLRKTPGDDPEHPHLVTEPGVGFD